MSSQQDAALRRVKELADAWARPSGVNNREVMAQELYVALAIHKDDPPLAGPTLGYMVLNREKPDDTWDGLIHPWKRAVDELGAARSKPAEYGTGWYLAEIHLVQQP